PSADGGGGGSFCCARTGAATAAMTTVFANVRREVRDMPHIVGHGCAVPKPGGRVAASNNRTPTRVRHGAAVPYTTFTTTLPGGVSCVNISSAALTTRR